MHLNVTTTSGCRGRCVYCPQDRYWGAMADRPRFLTAAELRALVPQLEGTRFATMSFGGFSEPFDNPEIVELLSLAHELEFVEKLVVYSNGEAMTPATMRSLAHVDFETVDVSCHGFDPETYRRTRSFIDPAAVRENVLYLLENRANIRNLTISVSGPFGSDESLAELDDLCAAAGATLFRRDLHSRAGLLRIGNGNGKPKSGAFRCAKFDFEKPVLVPGGDLSLCCQDFALRYVLGNLHERPFAELMASSPLRTHVLEVAAGRRDDPDLACYSCVFCVPA
ncbi:MAG TPA: radical SAM/SPASM domain-containing protein [Gaiellaceae bacterium]|jgi:pyruvate-formate lyase-activating enzyme